MFEGMVSCCLAMGCSSSISHEPSNLTDKHKQYNSTNGHIRPEIVLSKDTLDGKSNSTDSENQKRPSTPPQNGILIHNKRSSNAANGRLSPSGSERTDTNRSVKKVAFTDNHMYRYQRLPPITSENSNKDVEARSIVSSPTDRKRAKRKRERNMRKRLLEKLSAAEVVSDRALLESDRLSFGSSMSRATSRPDTPASGNTATPDGVNVTADDNIDGDQTNDKENEKDSSHENGHCNLESQPPQVNNKESTFTESVDNSPKGLES